jgi:amidophosphoribosyltransferase
MARDAGAKKVFFSSAAPPIRYPNIYGIDIPTQKELIAFDRTEEEIAAKIGCDWVMYQDLQDLKDSITEVKPAGKKLITDFTDFDTSCFSGEYVTGQKVGDAYFTRLHNLRNDRAQEKRKRDGEDVDGPESESKPRPKQSNNGCDSLSNDQRAGAN